LSQLSSVQILQGLNENVTGTLHKALVLSLATRAKSGNQPHPLEPTYAKSGN